MPSAATHLAGLHWYTLCVGRSTHSCTVAGPVRRDWRGAHHVAEQLCPVQPWRFRLLTAHAILSEWADPSQFQLLFSRAVWPCAAHGPGSGLADMHSPAALAAHATAAAVPSADSCFSHSSYSNPISSPGLQIFTMYFTMLVNIYCFFPFVYYIWWFFCFRHLKRTSCAKWWVAAVSQLPALCFQF